MKQFREVTVFRKECPACFRTDTRNPQGQADFGIRFVKYFECVHCNAAWGEVYKPAQIHFTRNSNLVYGEKYK